VPCVTWSPREAAPDEQRVAGDALVPLVAPTSIDAPRHDRRLTERAVAHLPVVDLPSAAALAFA
jgi:hypothetical protein